MSGPAQISRLHPVSSRLFVIAASESCRNSPSSIENIRRKKSERLEPEYNLEGCVTENKTIFAYFPQLGRMHEGLPRRKYDVQTK